MRQVKYFLKLAYTCSLLLSLYSCGGEIKELKLLYEIPLPSNHLGFTKTIFEKAHAEQIHFSIIEPYPSTSSFQYYSTYLKEHGWTDCSIKSPSWRSFVDLSSSNSALKYEIISYWSHPKEQAMLILSSQFESKSLSNNVPSNEKQNILIWAQYTKNYNSELLRLGAKCPVK